jgi:lysine-ketoglutarate reductase/saccharopine dehydrogenase-like protein (TIGR00300 family)
VEVISLHTVDPRFHHLAMVLCSLPGGHLLYHPGAFDSHSLREIDRLVPQEQRLAVEEEDALRFSCNAVSAGGTLITAPLREGLRSRLRERGIGVVEVDLGEFHRAGISARDLCLRLDEPRPGPGKAICHLASEEVELQGHLINTGLMAKMLDLITDNGCSFDIIQFTAGQRPDDPSVARLRVTAPRPAVLQSIVAQIKARGGETEGAAREAHLVEVEQDGVAPPDFLVTTIYPTDVLVDRRWIEVEQRRMDATVVVDRGSAPPRAFARLMRDVRRGDLVVSGHDGVRVRVPEEGADGKEDFAFMSSSVSSERRVEIEVERIAWEMRRIRDRGGKIVVVPGPVVIHTGGGPHLASLIREGHIQALLGGNAIAAHDIEQSIYSTSLGVDLRSGHVVEGGHRHHLRVINEVRRHGSIAAAVRAGFVRAGVMHACVTAGVPFVLAGSIRDDGPLPDTVMDLVEAQRLYQEQVQGADMILMLSTMLHAIGTGNMTPSGVRLICVDISPAVVTKLADRGSLESVGIVTDVGLFLSMLCAKLEVVPGGETATR